ncbi:hypothetical protein D3C71_1882450 [compost metagenome]
MADDGNFCGVHRTVDCIPGQPFTQPQKHTQQYSPRTAQPSDGTRAEVGRIHVNLITDDDVISPGEKCLVSFPCSRA